MKAEADKRVHRHCTHKHLYRQLKEKQHFFSGNWWEAAAFHFDFTPRLSAFSVLWWRGREAIVFPADTPDPWRLSWLWHLVQEQKEWRGIERRWQRQWMDMTKHRPAPHPTVKQIIYCKHYPSINEISLKLLVLWHCHHWWSRSVCLSFYFFANSTKRKKHCTNPLQGWVLATGNRSFDVSHSHLISRPQDVCANVRFHWINKCLQRSVILVWKSRNAKVTGNHHLGVVKLSFTWNDPVSRKIREFGVKEAEQDCYKLEEWKGLLKLLLHHFLTAQLTKLGWRPKTTSRRKKLCSSFLK